MSNIRDVHGGNYFRARRATSISKIMLMMYFAIAVSLFAPVVFASNLNRVSSFNIKAQTLEKALLQFGVQAHVQIVFASKSRMSQVRATALKGKYTGRQALVDLLRGSKFTFVDDGNTTEILPKTLTSPKTSRQITEQPGQTKSNAVPDHERPDPATVTSNPKQRPIVKHVAMALKQVIVTGTHLTGGPPPSTPIISITRRQILQSGYQTVEQVMDSLPENFAAVGSESGGVMLSSDVNAGNIGSGAAVDLMGLGADSTLVLVNGHRLAPSGTSGAFTDVSVIPLSAIKRIDIMTDGASAIYGADAIGGVVNYVLRSHEHGLETSVEYGSVTSGGLKSYRASQSGGLNWSDGNAFLVYDFQRQKPLSAADRSLNGAVGLADLLPGLTQNSVYATATNSVAGTRMETDAFFSTRNGIYAGPNFGFVLPHKVRNKSTQYSIGVQSSIPLSGDWTERARVSYGGNDTHLSDIYGTEAAHDTLLTLSSDVSGDIVKLASGNIKAAFGAQLRKEHFARHYGGGLVGFGAIKDKNRTVGALFGELGIPLFNSRNRTPRRPTLELNLAARYERYNDFGSSFNPSAGIAWKPVAAFRVRGTLGTSFKPPNFYELYGPNFANLENAPNLQFASGLAPFIDLSGSNPNLKAERSTEWTAGIDLKPASLHSLNLHATYFHIVFRNRIASPNVPYVDTFLQSNLYAPFIQGNPSINELNSLTQTATEYLNLTTYPGYGPTATLSDAMAILNNRLQNIGVTRVSGVDDTASYEVSANGFKYHGAINTAYLFRYQNLAHAGARPIDLLSTLENPVDFRGRMTAGIDREGWSFHGALNYVNHYSDPNGSAPVRIASWTTVDLQVAYRPLDGHVLMSGLQIALSCTNCLDRAPPAVRIKSYRFGYDPTNASPMGRFLSLTLRKRW